MSDVMVSQGNGLFQMTAKHAANLGVKQKLVDALFVNDWNAVGYCLHSSFELREPAALPFGGTYRGVEGFRKCWELIPKISHVTKRIETLHTYLTENPDHLWVELDFTGTRLDNGQEVAGIVMEKFEFTDGLISAIILYWYNIPDFKQGPSQDRTDRSF